MITPNVIDAIIKQAPKETKDKVLSLFIKDVIRTSYNDNRVNHILEMLLNDSSIIKVEDISLYNVQANFDKFLYHYEEYNIIQSNIKSVNNIEGTVEVEFRHKITNKETNADEIKKIL